MKRIIAVLALLGLASTVRAADAPAEKIAAGLEFARAACGTCHLVAQEGAEAATRRPAAPDLAVLAQRPRVTETSLRKLLIANHHNFRASNAIPNHAISDSQTDALVAYMLSLKSGN
jgi:mono/diheme cytochrome c family protein